MYLALIFGLKLTKIKTEAKYVPLLDFIRYDSFRTALKIINS
jgi:hypothetical protein